jgi:hypothetical protein
MRRLQVAGEMEMELDMEHHHAPRHPRTQAKGAVSGASQFAHNKPRRPGTGLRGLTSPVHTCIILSSSQLAP